jgi:hypothetical protein
MPTRRVQAEPVAEDAVDDLIEMVLSKGGSVVFSRRRQAGKPPASRRHHEVLKGRPEPGKKK